MTSKLWTFLFWSFRLILLALLYVVLWRVVTASLRSVGEAAGARQPAPPDETPVDRTAEMRETPVLISLSKRPEPVKDDGAIACRLLVLDHPSGGAPKGKRDVFATGEEIPVHLPLRMGRMAECDVVTRDRYSSGMHARLYERGGSLYVEDLGSTNGTYVNGARVKRTASLQDGDVLQIGETSFLVKR